MAAKVESGESDLEQTLKPFYDRATEAEARLAKLEELLVKKGGSEDDTKVSSIVEEFQSKLSIANAEITSEKEKASKEIQKLTAENQKLKYRIAHLIRALNEADSKLAASRDLVELLEKNSASPSFQVLDISGGMVKHMYLFCCCCLKD